MPIKLIESGEVACSLYQRIADTENIDGKRKVDLILDLEPSFPKKFVKKIK